MGLKRVSQSVLWGLGFCSGSEEPFRLSWASGYSSELLVRWAYSTVLQHSTVVTLWCPCVEYSLALRPAALSLHTYCRYMSDLEESRIGGGEGTLCDWACVKYFFLSLFSCDDSFTCVCWATMHASVFLFLYCMYEWLSRQFVVQFEANPHAK